MENFNWRDEENLPELPLTGSEKLSKKLRETPLATWRVIRWVFCAIDIILIALMLFISTLTRTMEVETLVRTLGGTTQITSTRTVMAYPGLIVVILLMFIIFSILFMYIDSQIWRCTNCHIWMSNPFKQRRYALFYIGLCPNCETSINSMISGESHTGKNIQQIREEHYVRILENGGWSCSCGRANPSHHGTCACGQSKNVSP